ncbi:MAG: uroporphyrinogen decarboxylase family protein [candidate division NC10 bacterium]|nr:uroporphyrinogen decarboxylase family protein [candidate division NC10 bacterium]
MNIKERILAALNWEEPDRVPLTIYDWMLPRGMAERKLREAGVGLITRLPAHRVQHRQVEFITREYQEQGRRLIRRTLRTPVGEVWQTLEPESAYETSHWIQEHFIKAPGDYAVMEFYIRDAIYQDNFATIREAQRRMGDDGIVLVRVAKAPIQEMLYQMMGLERFAWDYHERRDLFDSLHATLMERYSELYDLAAESPVEIIQLADNITADVVGRERFRNYLMPEYSKLRGRLAGVGKKLAVHMDGRLASLREEIATAQFDILEAMTPSPMGDVSVKEGREAWPDKALWINFTSSLHIASDQVIEAHTRQLLEEAGGKRGFAISVTEDAPVEALERSLTVISRILQE